MCEKKPVYNGYEERYLTGADLKLLFENQYFATGRHHSVIIGLPIPMYLQSLEINDLTTYRIFINQFFCRIMDGTTDKLISFFGHTSLQNINLSIDPNSIQLEETCPVCGSPMRLRTGKFGEFLGCSRFPACKHTMSIPIIGHC